jgi:hypothetical protein
VPAAEPEYKVIETSTVTDEALERIINDTVGASQGWQLDQIRFAMQNGSKRPSMAFLFFTRARADGVG